MLISFVTKEVFVLFGSLYIATPIHLAKTTFLKISVFTKNEGTNNSVLCKIVPIEQYKVKGVRTFLFLL
jgi:hypothetical protein